VTRAIRVLVVDDDAPIRDAVAALLAEEGYDARGAGSRAEALGRVDDWRPDVLLLDVAMPGGRDAEVLVAAARRRRGGGGVPLVLMSATVPHALPPLAARVGAAAYLAKPLEAEHLLAAIARAAGRGA
jgi:two-component system response regulator MprA